MPLTINTDVVPVELTTAEGYNEFVASPLCNDYSTVFPDNDSTGYVLVNDEVVATVSGEVKDSLFSYPQYASPIVQHDLRSVAL